MPPGSRGKVALQAEGGIQLFLQAALLAALPLLLSAAVGDLFHGRFRLVGGIGFFFSLVENLELF